ncbi:MAG TPA: hypothetical protein PLA94_06200 [Myxococcota bacterium]|nr:hypothetical protein [Myxococcota bacterium]
MIFAEPAGGLGEGTLGDTGLRCKRARNSEPLRGELKLWFEAWTFCSPHWRTLLCHAASASYPDYLTYVRTATFGAHTVEVRLHERLPAQPPCLLAVVHPVGLALEQREQLQLLKDRGVAIVGVDAGRDHARSRALGYVEGYLEARWKR